jgi:3-methyladenine DNA glycosylase Tag
MGIEILTKEDLQIFRMQLVDDFRSLIVQFKPAEVENLKGLKTRHVRTMLDCSTNKVQSLRIAGKLRFKKVGGTIYYNRDDVKKLLNEGD